MGSSMIRHIRFHGRGGEGVKLASRIVSRSAFLAGFSVQDSPIYGAERRGAPVAAFVRFGTGPISERGYIENPDAVVVMDDSLLHAAEAAVLSGLDSSSLVIVNSARGAQELQAWADIPGRVVALDISSIALEVLGHNLLSAPIAGLTVKVGAIAPWEMVAKAVQIELEAIGLDKSSLQRNLSATRRAYDQGPVVDAPERMNRGGPPISEPCVVPRLPPRLAAPSVSVAGTSVLRTMEGWRVYRPVIDLARCSRCFICFALCPEGAIELDADNYPVVDYAHCKGCLVCTTECPPKAIGEVREEAA